MADSAATPSKSDIDDGNPGSPIETIDLDSGVSAFGDAGQAAAHRPIKVKRKRRNSVQAMVEFAEETGDEQLAEYGRQLEAEMKAAGGTVDPLDTSGEVTPEVIAGDGSAPKSDKNKKKRTKPGKTKKKTKKRKNDLSRRRELQMQMSSAYIWLTVFAFIGPIVMIVELELLYEPETAAAAAKYESKPATDVLKGIVSFSSCVAFIFLLRYQALRYQYIEATEGQLALERGRVGRILTTILEIMITCGHVPPFVNFTWTAGATLQECDATSCDFMYVCHIDMLSLIMLARIYLLPRFMLYTSELWTSPTVAMVASMNSITISISMATKLAFAKRPFTFTLCVCFVPYVASSIMFSYCERLLSPEYANWGEIFYYLFLAFSGEVAVDAATECGKISLALLIINGMIGASLLMTLLINAFTLDPDQQMLIATLDRQKLEHKIKNEAALGIQRVLRLFASIRALKASREAALRGGDDSGTSGGNSPNFKKLQSSPGRVHEKDLQRMIADKKYYNEYVWNVMQQWKRAKRAPPALSADFTTKMTMGFRELDANVGTTRAALRETRKALFPEGSFKDKKRRGKKASPRAGEGDQLAPSSPTGAATLLTRVDNLETIVDTYDESEQLMREHLHNMSETLNEFIQIAKQKAA